jgi:hypothetical protein
MLDIERAKTDFDYQPVVDILGGLQELVKSG